GLSINRESPLRVHRFAKYERTAEEGARQPGKAEGIHLVLGRDSSDQALAEIYESSNVILPSDLVDNPPVTTPDARWLRYGDQALAAAQEEQRRIKEKIRPHVERYNKITGHKR